MANDRMANEWPRLSETLTRTRRVDRCQACGGVGVTWWEEHDSRDRPEGIIVTLCQPCSERLIEPHPRLYRPLASGEPWPGAMPTCLGCKHSADLNCKSPLAKANGGPGLPLSHPPPARAFVCGRGGKGGPRTVYYGRVRCHGCEPTSEDGN